MTVGVRVSVGVRVTVGVREGVLVFVGVRVIVGLRVLVGMRVFVGVWLTAAVAAAVEDDCAIGCGTNAQPIATTAHEIINQLTTRLIKINLDPILPTHPPGAANSAPGARLYPIEAHCGRTVEETLFLCYNPAALSKRTTERCQSG